MKFFQKHPKYKLFLVVVDFIIIHVSFCLALKVRYLGSIDAVNLQNMSIAVKWLTFTPFSFIMIFYFQYADLYKFQNIVSPKTHVNLIIKTVILSVFGYILYQFVIKNFNIDSRLYYMYFASILCFLFVTVRMYLARFIRNLPSLRDKVVIIGTGVRGSELLKTFSEKAYLHNIIGFIDDHSTNSMPTMGKVKDAEQIAEKHGIKSFILAFDNISRERFFEIFRYFQNSGLVLSVSSDYFKILHNKYDGLDIYDKFKLVTFYANDRHNFLINIKRIYDFIFSFLGLIVLSPVFLIISFLVKLSSPGPILYSHFRIGKNGKPFKFYKFRSMIIGSDTDQKRLQNVESFIKGNSDGTTVSTKIVNKQNITRIGAFLRKHSLDELPQLFNVLKGDMSLVGPRPCLTKEWEVYEDWQRLKFSTVPGCTGMWQVYGRSGVNFEESVLMDIYYNQNFTPWLDLKLILKTVSVVLFGKGGE